MSERLLKLPRLGETMETGRIVEWLKKPGDRFQRGETIAEIETDKTVVELPALTDGTILEILAEPGAEVTVDMPLARIDDERATGPEEAEKTEPRPGSATAENEPRDRPGPTAAPDTLTAPGSRRRATPAARRIARLAGIDIETVTGTGPRGRVETADIRTLTDGRKIQDRPGQADDRLPVSGGYLHLRRWRPQRENVGKQRSTALLLHGFGADGSTWLPIGPLLAQQHGIDVIALDLPSHGASTVEPNSVSQLIAMVTEAVRNLDPAPDILIGHSMGALVAADLAGSGALPCLKRLMLISPAGMSHTINNELLQALAWADTAETLDLLMREIGGHLPPPPPAVCRQILAQNRSHPTLPDIADDLAGLAGQRHSLPQRLESVTIPTSVVMGTEDVMFPWVQVASLPPTVAIHLINGGGHIPHWEQPETIVRLIVGG